MNGSQFFYSSLVKAFHCSNPEVNIGINRILYQYRNIHTLESISNFLHCKRICSCPGTYPKYIHPIFQSFVNMFYSRHFNGCQHPGFLLDFFQPCQSFRSNTFECIRPGPWFPYTSPENLNSK